MLYNENVTVKQIVYLLISCGFQKCELWFLIIGETIMDRHYRGIVQ